MTHHEESAGLVSASKFEIVALCEGQAALEANLRDHGLLIVESEPDEFALLGTKLHKALELRDDSDLSEDERDIYKRGVDNECRIQSDWVREFNIFIAKPHDERRIWLYWPPDGIEPATSARLDYYDIGRAEDSEFMTHALIIERKTLWCSNLTPAERNWQGLVQAVCVFHAHGVQHVRVAFNKAMFGKSDIVDYTLDDLGRADAAIFQKLWAAKQPGAATHAGPWCRHCPCQPHCVSAASYSLLPSVVAGVSLGVKKADVESAVQRLGPADWKYIHERGSVIRNILDAAKSCLKKLSADDLAALGLQIGEGKRLDPITNVVGAYKALEHSLPPELLWGCLSFEKGRIVEAVKAHKKITKKEAEAWVRDTLQPFIEEKRSEGSLEERE
jgi:hypothetical protein